MKKVNKLVANIIVILFYVLLILVLVWGIKATTKQLTYEVADTYKVGAGETLWNICKKYKPDDVDLREYIFEVEQHNGITANIRAGQTIELLKVKEG